MSKLPSRTWPIRAAIVTLVWIFTPITALATDQRCSIATVFHRPCPGCGLTRATLLFLHGDFGASFAMHPLAIPILATWGAVAIATIHATYTEGVPWHFFKKRFGRVAVFATAVAYVALFALWFAREGGFFGGRVAI